jgi:2-methylcitrate dehydratase PrpD
MPFAERLAEQILSPTPNAFSDACFKAATQAVLDTVGVTLAGAVSETAKIIARTTPLGYGPCHIIGGSQQCDPLNAALLNGTAAHALDFDDMTQNMMGHPSVALVPALFALGEQINASGREILKSYLIGFETACKLGRAVTYAHHDKGWHGTATIGIFGAVAACCTLLKYDTTITAQALSIATSLASGLRANFGTMTKPLHAGNAGRNAIFATLAAKEGFTANTRAFESSQGFFDVFLGTDIARPERALEKWYYPPEILDPGVCLKLYPSGAHTHPFIEMVRSLVTEHSLTIDMIERIDVLSEQSRHDHINRPYPHSGLEAKWSIHYLLARTLTDGWPKLSHFSDSATKAPNIRALMARVHAKAHPDMDATWADKYGGEVVITTTHGQQHHAQVEHVIARGPSNPMSDKELRTKFLDCAVCSLTEDQAENLFTDLKSLAKQKTVISLLGKTHPAH